MNRKANISKTILKTLGKKTVFETTTLENEVRTIVPTSTKTKPEYVINRSIKNLEDAGLVERIDSDNNSYLRLTKTGKQKLNSITLDNEDTLVNTSWDGYFRIILLDVSEDRKSEREALRYLLKKAGFVCVKNSVWISIHPYEHLFTNIKNDLGFTTELMIIVTNKLDKETEKVFLESLL